MQYKITLPLLALALSAFGATASAAGLKECLSRAEANSPAVNAYEQKLASALAAADRDAKARRPQLNATGEDGYSSYAKDSGLANGLNGTLGLELTWDLPKVISGYQRLAQVQARKAGVMLALAKRILARDVEKDYYRLHILAGKKADYAAAGEYFTSHIKDIEALQDRGLDVKLDLLRAGMQLRSLGVAAAGIDTELQNALMSLNSAAGTGYKMEDFNFSDVPAPAVVTLPAGAAAAAPETRLGELELKTAEENYRQSAYFYAPSLALGFNKALTPIDPATERYRTYLSVSLPVFDFGRNAADRKSLLADREYQKELNLESSRKLQLSITALQAGIKTAAAACAAAEAGLADADKAMHTAGEYYRQGKFKETDLLSVFSDYLAAKEAARDALWDYLDKKADLDYYTEAL